MSSRRGGSGPAGRRLVRIGTMLAAGGLLLLAGCSGASDARNTVSTEPAQAGPPAGGGGTGESAAGAQKDTGAADAAEKAGSVTLPRALVRTAELTVRVDDVAAAARDAQDHARSAGGATAGDDRSGTGAEARADLVLKLPPARLDSALDRFGALGEELRRTSSTQDVTEDVADIDVRVASMQASIARVRAILARATRIGDVVSVEGELSRRTTELESLQARQRALAGQVGLATVTLHLLAREVRAAAPPAERSGFLGGLQDGWDAFSTAVSWLLTALGTVLPFLIVLVPALLAVRWYARRQRPAVAPATAAAPPAPAGQSG